MRRILIIGCSGSGKSELALSLSRLQNIPVVHIDQLGWLPNWVRRPFADYEGTLREKLAAPAWIIDGNSPDTIETRLRFADTLIWVSTPIFVCLWRIITRTISYWGRQRPDGPPGCQERLHLTQLRAVIRYHLYSKHKILAAAREASAVRLIRVSGTWDTQMLAELAKGEVLARTGPSNRKCEAAELSTDAKYAAYIEVYKNLDTLLWQNIATLMGITVLTAGSVGAVASQKMALQLLSPEHALGLIFGLAFLLYSSTIFSFARIRYHQVQMDNYLCDMERSGYFCMRAKIVKNRWLSAPRWTITVYGALSIASGALSLYYIVS